MDIMTGPIPTRHRVVVVEVVLKDGVQTASVSAQASSLSAKYGAEVSRTYSSALNGFSIHATEAEAKPSSAPP